MTGSGATNRRNRVGPFKDQTVRVVDPDEM